MSEIFPYPHSVQRLIEQFGKLPGIGNRTAERLAYHILAGSREEAMALAKAIHEIKTSIRACSRCFNVAEGDLCAVCSSPGRDRGSILTVELPRDIISIEKTSSYRGVYHALQGHLSPSEGIGPEDLRIAELKQRIRDQAETETPVREVILALNPTAEGDVTAQYLADELTQEGVHVTRLARGLASGTFLESTAPSSLQLAIQDRQAFRRESD